MGKNVKCTIHCANIHQVEERKHKSYAFEKITCPGISVFDNHSKGAEDTIYNKEINCAGEKALDKTGKRTKNTVPENEEVHKEDIGHNHPCKDDGFPVAISLKCHLA